MNSINLESLDLVVISGRTGNPVASFLLRGHAKKFIEALRAVEGPHCPMYEVVNADGSPLVNPIQG